MEADLKALRSDFARLQSDVSKLTSTLQHLVQHGRREGTEQMTDILADLESSLEEKVQGLTRQAKKTPAAAATLTFGLGLLLGLLFAGRRG